MVGSVTIFSHGDAAIEERLDKLEERVDALESQVSQLEELLIKIFEQMHSWITDNAARLF